MNKFKIATMNIINFFIFFHPFLINQIHLECRGQNFQDSDQLRVVRRLHVGFRLQSLQVHRRGISLRVLRKSLRHPTR